MSCLYDSSKPSTEAIVIGQRCKRRDLAKAIRSQRHRHPSFRRDEVGYFEIYSDAHAKRCSHVLDIHTIGRTASSIHAANILQHYDINWLYSILAILDRYHDITLWPRHERDGRYLYRIHHAHGNVSSILPLKSFVFLNLNHLPLHDHRKMYFHATIPSTDAVWFASWVPSSVGAVIGTSIGLFLLGTVSRLLLAVQRGSEWAWKEK